MKQRKRRIFAGVAAVAMLLWNFAALPQDTPLPQLELPVKAATVTEAVAPTAQATEIPANRLVPVDQFRAYNGEFKGEAYYKYMELFKYDYKVERTTLGDWTFTTVEFKILGSNFKQFNSNDDFPIRLPYEVRTTVTDYWTDMWFTSDNVTDPSKHIVTFKVTEIADDAFDYYHTPDLTIPASVKTIGKNAFKSAAYLENVYIDNRVVTYDQSGVLNPEGEEITVDTTSVQLSTIDDSAFENCLKLKNFDLSDASYLTSVGNAAFR
ncbi:MAG: leucine-rich repeat domain-containing protein, partial [Oscillospiraceae bacterium]|nr:leucine-rich repeat domain-containing protein [Oscillospiraceae bacterium]